MAGYTRKAWTIPDRVFDVLDHFPKEVEYTVIRAIRAYNKFWDINRCDDGFNYDFSSDIAKAIFFSVYDDIKSLNRQYFDKCSILSENAKVGVIKRNQTIVRRKSQKEYYETHKDIINSKRRAKYAAKVKEAKEKTISDTLDMTKQSDENSDIFTAKRVAQKSANAHKIIGLNKLPSLHSDNLLGIKGCGEKGKNDPQEQEPADFPNNNRTSGLSCNKAEQTREFSSVCNKAVNGNKIAGNKEKSSQEKGNKDTSTDYKHSFDKAVIDSARNSCAKSCPADKKQKYTLLSAPHTPQDQEILITSDFSIDLTDTHFYPYRRMDNFLKKGIENWLIDRKLGCSVEKKWIMQLIHKFAVKQGKLAMLLGEE